MGEWMRVEQRTDELTLFLIQREASTQDENCGTHAMDRPSATAPVLRLRRMHAKV
jgi:hypothetical protein